MGEMRVALLNITPDFRTLGLLNVSTYLGAKGYPNLFLTFLAPYLEEVPASTYEATAAFLQRQRPRVIGISLTTFYFAVARRLTAAIRARLPEACIVWGGIHPTIKPEECLEYCDVVCRGEGEEPFLDLLRALEHGGTVDAIPNLWSRKGGEVKKNDIRPLCQDLDSRPFPRIDWQRSYITHRGEVVPLDRGLFHRYRPKQGTVYEVMATRGCPLACSYCCNSTFHRMYRGKGRVLRFRSIDHIIAELRYVKETFPRVKAINFEDDAFGVAPDDFLVPFCEAYRREVALPFHIRLIPHLVTERKIALLKDAGLVGAVMGLQASDRINREVYRRPTTRAQFLEVARLLRHYKVVGRYDVIIDNPYSTEEDEIEAIRTFMAVPKPYHLYVYPLAYFPGTALTERVIADRFYDEESAGYSHIYGSDRHRYPDLARLIKMVPFTPRSLMRGFLALRRTAVGKGVIALYYNTVFRLEEMVIALVMRNAGWLLFMKKLLLRG